MNNTPSGAKKHHKRKSPDSQMFSFSSSSDGLVQNCVILLQWYSQKAAGFYTEQCTSPSLFTTLKSHKAVRASH